MFFERFLKKFFHVFILSGICKMLNFMSISGIIKLHSMLKNEQISLGGKQYGNFSKRDSSFSRYVR